MSLPRKKILFSIFVFLVFFFCLFYSFQGKRTNILLLGVPGENYSGPSLTDTIILLSVNPAHKDLVLVSVPRDIWIGSFQTKINTLYELGGLDLLKREVNNILGLESIDLTVVFDFEGFKKAIDLVGGLEVEVEHAFDDFKYPIVGRENDDCQGDLEYKCRYEHLHFDKGPTFMDGELALKFARSRFATNSGEGTDFARSKRQQKIILAFKEKIFSRRLFLNPKIVLGFFKIWRENIETDFKAQNFLKLLVSFFRVNWERPRMFSLNWGEENQGGLLFNPPIEEYGSWVLVPRSGDWQEVQRELKQFLNPQNQTSQN